MLNQPTGSCVACGLHEPKRNNYFAGKFLTERDFTAQADYHRGQQFLHNSLLHGTGTVCGLKLIQHPSENCRRDFVVLEPGMALDCCGRQLTVPERTLIRVADMLQADPDLAAALDGSRHLVLGLEACDVGVEPVPAILPGCGSEGQDTDYGYIAERYHPVLWAVDPAQLSAGPGPQTAQLNWKHSTTLGAQTPRALFANEPEGYLQVAADARDGGSHLYLHDAATGDLAALLEGPASLCDTAAMREARLLLAAGSGWKDYGEGTVDGIGFWPADSVHAESTAAGLLPLDAPLARLAVSPVSGVLCVLELLGADAARLTSYAPDKLLGWLADGGEPERAPAPIGVLEFDHGFGDESTAAGRGAGMIRFSHDGRFLALAAPGAGGKQHCYLVDVSTLNSGALTQAAAVADAVPAGTDVVGIDWSLDDGFLYLCSGHAGDEGPEVQLHRYARIGEGTSLERRGRGAQLAGTPRDLCLSPTETHAFVLLADADGITRLTVVDLETVKHLDPDTPEVLVLSDSAIRFDADGRCLTLTGQGSRLYLAAGDSDAEKSPDRGLVAVIDIREDECGIYLTRQLDSCPSCSSAEHGCGCNGTSPDPGNAVILGHLPNYVAADHPVMVDEGTVLEGQVPIDNLSYRTLVPSAATLREIVQCMLRRGIDVGPPGPRGDQGRDGVDGKDGTDGTAGKDGKDGKDGVDGKDGADGKPVESNPIIAVSWIHAQEYSNPNGISFGNTIFDMGIALVFEKPVLAKPLQIELEAKRNMIAYLQRNVSVGQGSLSVWADISQVVVLPLAPDPEVQGTQVVKWEPDEGAELTPGIMLRVLESDFSRGETLRVEFYADFLATEEGIAVSGAHLGGLLPTGGGGPGGTFRSWFTVPRDG